MFGFLPMMDNYEDRMLENHKWDETCTLDTVKVNDAEYLYETAISHKDYNNGKWIILGGYDTKEDARKFHAKWKKKIDNNKLPKVIKDNGGSEIGKMAAAIGCKTSFKRKEKTNA